MNAAIILITLASTSLILVEHVSASDRKLNLPPAPVTIEVYNGTKSYFDTVMSNVPTGFDVVNETYLGWCVDKRYLMPRSPVTHQVTLFSSRNPPLNLSSEKWDMVNYILNHKQGNPEDIQQAIWYFVNMVGNHSASSTKALAMVDDAKVNGTGFVPGIDQIVAVICYTTEPNTQISVIEARIPTLITDLNRDGVVNIVDIRIVARAFGSKLDIHFPDPRWNPIADMNHDGIVNIIDISIVAKDFGKKADP
jgi:hypothetical protein